MRPQYSKLYGLRANPRFYPLLCGVLAIALPNSFPVSSARAETFDVVIYGGTSAAISSAIQAKQSQKSVVVVSPDKHLGGLTSGGLGWTDTGNKAVIGGLARQFYHRIWKKYQSDQAWRWQSRDEYGNRGQGTPSIDGDAKTMWIFEPHIAEQVFDQWVDELGIRVDRDQWLDRQQGVKRRGAEIESITTLSGKSYVGRMFIDATYEGDLMAAAGVAYHVGRESNQTYGEQHNGVQIGVLHHHHHFDVLKQQVDPYVIPGDPSSGVIARVSPDPPGEFGAADKRVQAYCFRMCLTDHPENRVPFEKPDGYDPNQYELMARVFAAGWMNVFKKFDPIPNRKTDTNNHGPMSTDNIGYNYDYPDATYERRREIIREHELYQRGWLYFLTTDPRVPESIATEARRWGLAADEFKDNHHWPHQMYIREARRMIGTVVMTENHLRKITPTPDSVGMGSYTIDSHNVQRYITPAGYVQNEGDIAVPVKPYEIAFGSLVPKANECKNLVVPVCVSSSHIAYGSIRMEPVFMILGQSAATIAALAIDRNCSVQEVPYPLLRQRLLADGQILTIPSDEQSSSLRGRDPRSFPGIVVDNTDATLTGLWTVSAASKHMVGDDYAHDKNARNGQCTATFVAHLTEPGKYQVRVSAPANANRSTRVPVRVQHAQGESVVTINQRDAKREDELFIPLGIFHFEKGAATVTLSNQDSDGYVIADAIQFHRVTPK